MTASLLSNAFAIELAELGPRCMAKDMPTHFHYICSVALFNKEISYAPRYLDIESSSAQKTGT